MKEKYRENEVKRRVGSSLSSSWETGRRDGEWMNETAYFQMKRLEFRRITMTFVAKLNQDSFNRKTVEN